MILLQTGKLFKDRILVNWGWWHCPIEGCSFRRWYALHQGALNGASEHLYREHRIKTHLPRGQD